jgi:hypothetical protein
MYHNRSHKGFVVLIAVMVTTIILTMGIGVLNLALREFILANVGRDSVKAFYAADTGIDCVFSHDVSAAIATEPNFASPLGTLTDPTGGDSVLCNNQQLNTGSDGTVAAITDFVEETTCPDGAGVLQACSITKLSRDNNPTETDNAKRALCLGGTDGDGRCVGACVTMEVRKIATGADTQRTELLANGISDCQGPRPVERSLILTWE